MKSGIVIVLMVAVAMSAFRRGDAPLERQDKLSAYGFFQGELARLTPAANVWPYALNTPLFSNYAEKARFIALPEGAVVPYNDSVALDFPVGTVLIKSFYYPKDMRKPDGDRTIIETRLLVHQPKGWEAWPYVWNEAQTDAFYDPAGETRTVTYTDAGGKKVTTPYVVPNKNQCKGCHVRGKVMQPIGPSARQLNRVDAGGQHQLQSWASAGWLHHLPDLQNVPKLAAWDDASQDLNLRARAYLDANCAHCHSRQGPASTSGLFLTYDEKDPAHLGINKSPVAAGRGAGSLQYDVVPGSPQQSILLFRMKTNDPAIAMPEVGRETVHAEGVALIEAWIRQHPF